MTLAVAGFWVFIAGVAIWVTTVLFTRYRRATRIVATSAGWLVFIGFGCMIVAKVYT
jgi:hypothetical protein